MIFNPINTILSNGQFTFGKKVYAVANKVLDKKILKDFWYGFTFHMSEIEFSETDELIFKIGDVKIPTLDGYQYAINIERNGICISAENEQGLIHGYMTLLDRIKLDGSTLAANCSKIKDRPLIKNRMVHFCVLPDTELWEIEKFVRLCGALKYSHIILEFWGMLKYECLEELSWKHAFTKEQLKPIIENANDMGLEVIPMFNHWGHASASRVLHGKHVVLDQNPTLQYLFCEDGWCWDIQKTETKELLKKIRDELLDLCGEGEYFHIGCDEAYGFDFSTESMNMLCDYINEVSSDLAETGRKTIMWGDMLLAKRDSFNPKNIYTAFCKDEECEKYMLGKLKSDITIADWQYWASEAPVETSVILNSYGRDVLICPWDSGDKEIDACAKTIRQYDLSGILHTTWHTLSKGMPYVLTAGVSGWQKDVPTDIPRTQTAALLRKVYPVNGDYTKAGWAKYEIGVLTD